MDFHTHISLIAVDIDWDLYRYYFANPVARLRKFFKLTIVLINNILSENNEGIHIYQVKDFN